MSEAIHQVQRLTGLMPSSLASKVATILDRVFDGWYHIDDAFNKAKWENPSYVEIRLRRELSTWDFNLLTQLVVLCHDEAIRLEISPCSNTSLKLLFHERQREGRMYERHPTIEDAIAMIRRGKKATAAAQS